MIRPSCESELVTPRGNGFNLHSLKRFTTVLGISSCVYYSHFKVILKQSNESFATLFEYSLGHFYWLVSMLGFNPAYCSIHHSSYYNKPSMIKVQSSNDQFQMLKHKVQASKSQAFPSKQASARITESW